MRAFLIYQVTRFACLVAAILCLPGWALGASSTVRFQKLVLTDKYYCDGVTAGDINRDGKMDVVAGPFWFEGPEFKTQHAFYPPTPFETAPSPTDSMFSYVYDFNRDGWLDILVLGRVHLHSAYWYENPGKDRIPGAFWKKHFAFHRVRGESPPFIDIDNDGRPELAAHWDNRWGFIRPDWKNPTNQWTFTAISPQQGDLQQFYHGTGVGDVNGDGRADLILNDGWFEQPKSPDLPWSFRIFRFGTKGGAQMFAYDVDQDGNNDVITSLDAHGWGLAWFRQTELDGSPGFVKKRIMGDRSEESISGVSFTQPHALAMADIDKDGVEDIVVGKRRWAHGPKGDIEPDAPPVLYWFQLSRKPDQVPRFIPYLIDDQSGVGVQITVTDINGDARPDVLSASKLGVFVFLNRFQEL